MSKITSNEAETPSKLVTFEVGGIKKYLFAGPAQFGRQLLDGFSVLKKRLFLKLILAPGYNILLLWLKVLNSIIDENHILNFVCQYYIVTLKISSS